MRRTRGIDVTCRELDEAGLSYRIADGGKHPKVLVEVAGREEPIICAGSTGDRRSWLAERAFVRRCIRRWREEQAGAGASLATQPTPAPSRNQQGNGTMSGSMIERVGETRLTMSSREIAELTGKRHDHVIRDIKGMLVSLYGAEHVERLIPEQKRNRHSEFVRENADAILNAIVRDAPNRGDAQNRGFRWERDNRGYIAIVHLDKSHTMTLIAGYDVPLRKAIIDRWMELEEAARAQFLPILDPNEIVRQIASLVDAAVAKHLEEVRLRTELSNDGVAALQRRVEMLAGLAIDSRAHKVTDLSIKEVLDELGVPPKHRRSLQGKVFLRTLKKCAAVNGVSAARDTRTRTWIFPREWVLDFVHNHCRDLIDDHCHRFQDQYADEFYRQRTGRSREKGQGILPFKPRSA